MNFKETKILYRPSLKLVLQIAYKEACICGIFKRDSYLIASTTESGRVGGIEQPGNFS